MKKKILICGLLIALHVDNLFYSMEEPVKNSNDISCEQEKLTQQLQYIFLQDYNNKSEEEAAQLIMGGANANTRVGRHKIPLLHYIASKGTYLNLIPLLLEKGIDINMQNASKSTPLMIAIRKRRFEVVKLLLLHHANVNAQACFGDTALISAARRGQTAIIKLLLEHHADPDLQNVLGETALLCAAAKGLKDEVELLLRYKANFKLRTNSGETVLSVSQERKDINSLFESFE